MGACVVTMHERVEKISSEGGGDEYGFWTIYRPLTDRGT
jgi:hypothetical protein